MSTTENTPPPYLTSFKTLEDIHPDFKFVLGRQIIIEDGIGFEAPYGSGSTRKLTILEMAHFDPEMRFLVGKTCILSKAELRKGEEVVYIISPPDLGSEEEIYGVVSWESLAHYFGPKAENNDYISIDPLPGGKSVSK